MPVTHLVHAYIAEEGDAGPQAASLARQAQRELRIVQGAAEHVTRVGQVLQQGSLVRVQGVEGDLQGGQDGEDWLVGAGFSCKPCPENPCRPVWSGSIRTRWAEW